jgi:exodeoxyribonuclease-3
MGKDVPTKLRIYNNYNAYICGRQKHQGVAAFSRYMEFTVTGLRFINIYTPQGQQRNSIHHDEKVIFYLKLIERVQALISNNILPIIAGNFNILPTPLDLFNPNSDSWRTNCMCLPAERSLFNKLLQLSYINAFVHYFPDTK